VTKAIADIRNKGTDESVLLTWWETPKLIVESNRGRIHAALSGFVEEDDVTDYIVAELLVIFAQNPLINASDNHKRLKMAARPSLANAENIKRLKIVNEMLCGSMITKSTNRPPPNHDKPSCASDTTSSVTNSSTTKSVQSSAKKAKKSNNVDHTKVTLGQAAASASKLIADRKKNELTPEDMSSIFLLRNQSFIGKILQRIINLDITLNQVRPRMVCN
jgi:hypothetical protein